jgi:hypothetical protein
MTIPGGIVDWLKRLRDLAVGSEIDRTQHFSFGSRTLALMSIELDGQQDFSTALMPAALAPGGAVAPEAAVPLYIVPSRLLGSLPDLSGIQFGPYGSIMRASGMGRFTGSSFDETWLVTLDIANGRLLALDTLNRIALFSSVTPLAPREIAEFARPLFHWIANVDGNVVIHAGAVALGDKGLLISGTGNAGKTTFVRSCVAAGMQFLGDNVIEVSLRVGMAPRPLLWGAYASLKVRPNPLGGLPSEWPAPLWDSEAEKHIYVLPHLAAPGNVLDVHHTATLTLERTASAALMRNSASAAFFSTAPNTVGQFPYFEREVLSRVKEVTAQKPAFVLGHVPYDEIPYRVREILS